MKPNFLLIKTECCNEKMNAPCRIIIQEVEHGNLLPQHVILINPGNAEFNFTVSALQLNDLKNCQEFPDVWPKIETLIRKYDIILSASDGYDIRILYNTLDRYAIQYNPIRYVNAKSICRKGFDLVSYSFDWLCEKFLNCYVESGETPKIAEAWAKFACIAVDHSENSDVSDFAKNHNIHIGTFAPSHFDNSHLKKIRIGKKRYTDFVDSDNITPDETNPLFGMTVVFSGKLSLCSRIEAQLMVVKIGGNPADAITKATDYLILGTQDIRVVGSDGRSSKMKKAIQLKEKGASIEVLSENDFYEIMGMSTSL